MQIRENLLTEIIDGYYPSKVWLTNQGFDMEENGREDGIYGVPRPNDGLFIKTQILNNDVKKAQVALEIMQNGKPGYAVIDGYIDSDRGEFIAFAEDTFMSISLNPSQEITTSIFKKDTDSQEYVGQKFTSKLDANYNLSFVENEPEVKADLGYVTDIKQRIENFEKLANQPEAPEPIQKSDSFWTMLLKKIKEIIEKSVSVSKAVDKVINLRFSFEEVKAGFFNLLSKIQKFCEKVIDKAVEIKNDRAAAPLNTSNNNEVSQQPVMLSTNNIDSLEREQIEVWNNNYNAQMANLERRQNPSFRDMVDAKYDKNIAGNENTIGG